jgi:hypothetical protein
VKARRGKLPLDDRHWITLDEAHKRLCERTGDPRLAARDLTEAMKAGRVASMRRPLIRCDNAPDRELLTPLHWVQHEAWWMPRESKEPILAVSRQDRRHPVGPDGFIGPSFRYVYYCRKLDLERLFPAPPASDSQRARHREPPIYGLIRQIAAELWPGGYSQIGTAAIGKRVGDKLGERGIPVPSRTTFERALGRRKD